MAAQHEKTDVAVIGGGAAGTMAAIASAGKGLNVVIIEGNDRLAAKIDATGNGRCNISNEFIDDSCYHSSEKFDSNCFFKTFGRDDLLDFFKDHGIYFHEKNGGAIYPRTDSAATISSALKQIAEESGVTVLSGRRAEAASIDKNGYFQINMIDNDGHRSDLETKKLLITTGGKAAPKTGSDGTGYGIAEKFGHTIIETLPALTNIITAESLKAAALIRCDASVKLLADGNEIGHEKGNIQFKTHSISGIPVMQLSGRAAYYLGKGDKCELKIDFIPELSDDDWSGELQRRMDNAAVNGNLTLAEFALGLVHPKIASLVAGKLSLVAESKIRNLNSDVLLKFLRTIRECHFELSGVGSFDEAQTTAGGIDLDEVTSDCESKLVNGLYFAGEILDVDGKCGGYNLTFAMCGGYKAGRSAADSLIQKTGR